MRKKAVELEASVRQSLEPHRPLEVLRHQMETICSPLAPKVHQARSMKMTPSTNIIIKS